MAISEPRTRRRAGRLASAGTIREAAASLFLERGYGGTSMDDIATTAQVSKQTIYTHFPNKEALFADLVLGNADRVDEFVETVTGALAHPADVAAALRQVARHYLGVVTRPDVLRLRRLVIGESGRFPELARTYYDRVPGRMIATFAELFGRLAAEGRLHIEDSTVAAQHFAWLVVGMPLDRGMFYPAADMRVDVDQMADAGVTAFLAAYATPARPAAGEA